MRTDGPPEIALTLIDLKENENFSKKEDKEEHEDVTVKKDENETKESNNEKEAKNEEDKEENNEDDHATDGAQCKTQTDYEKMNWLSLEIPGSYRLLSHPGIWISDTGAIVQNTPCRMRMIELKEGVIEDSVSIGDCGFKQSR